MPWPKFKLTQLLAALVAALMIALSARFEIRLPGLEVPQSAQTLAILLVAALLPKPYGVLAVLLYLIAGSIGLPVFAGGSYGWKHLTGNTGGYLLGFLLASLWIQITLKKQQVLTLLIHFLIAHAIILCLGGLWLSRFVGIDKAWQHGVSPFLQGALLKSLLAVIIVYGFNQLILQRTKTSELTQI